MNEAPDSVRTRNILQITPETVTLTATSVTDNARSASSTITIDTASMYIDFDGAADGTTINAAVLTASTHCGNGSWNSAHPSRGCSQANLVSTGGAGMFYCFAVN